MIIKLVAGNGFTEASLAAAKISVQINRLKTQAPANLSTGAVTAKGDDTDLIPLKEEGTMQKMLIIDGKALATTGTTMLIVSFALGSLIGEAINLEAAIENLGEWLKRKTGSEGDNEFTNAFVSTSLTVCIGAMAIVGSIQDGLLGDWSTLALKGALDCIIVCTMTASLGRGCIFSALPVAVFQGTITLFAGALSPIMTTAALNSLSLVGSMLIFCVGVNLIRPQTFRTANMLPSVVIAVIYALLF